MKNNAQNSISAGDLVLVHDDQLKRGQWKKGVIQSLVVGKDGQVRGVNLRIGGKGKPQFCSRPIQKVYPLEISCFRENDERDRSVESRDVNAGVRRESTEGNENGENVGMEFENLKESEHRPKRAAARDAQWKTRLMLDHS